MAKNSRPGCRPGVPPFDLRAKQPQAFGKQQHPGKKRRPFMNQATIVHSDRGSSAVILERVV